jgi:Holliday junction resolvasome RuvABC ATP-dependent DNA helicase subunit
MQINNTFEECVGQESVKQSLSLYIDAYQKTNRLPFINLTTQKGGGKTFFARKFREALKRSDGTRPPMLEINGKTIKNARSFFEQVYPMWTGHRAFLFIDEGHNLPQDLQQIFLSVLNVDKNPNRTVEFDGVPYDFNFEEISFCMATTDQQKLSEPLRDRLRDISFEEYNSDELFEIFENNLDFEVEVSSDVKEDIVSVFRGNPRDAVVKAEDAKTYAAARNVNMITKQIWSEICNTMGIHSHGLSNSEIQIVKALAQRGSMSLTGLSSVTGFERSAIQRDYEGMLVRKNLMKIDGHRELTADGVKLARQLQFV